MRHKVWQIFAIALLTFFSSTQVRAINLSKSDRAIAIFSTNSIAQITSISQLKDVVPQDNYYSSLEYLIEKHGLVIGYPDDTFRGTNYLTRHEFLNLLSASLSTLNNLGINTTQPSLDVPNNVVEIKDVSPTDWIFQSLQNIVYGYGVSLIYPDGTFRGTNSITHAELILYLNQAFGLDLKKSQDKQDIDLVTRGEFAIILAKSLDEVIVREENLLK
jgi:hypothetical protein